MAAVDEEIVARSDDEVKKEKKDKKRKREASEEENVDELEAERLNIAERKRLKKERKRQEKEQILESSLEVAKEKMADPLAGEKWREANHISVIGKGVDNIPYIVPGPFLLFRSTPFNENVINAFTRAGFTAPTATQSQSWPIILEGRDLISIAKTGSGKTMGFLLPCFHRMLQNKKYSKPLGFETLVLAPTRELATQIAEEATKFGTCNNIRVACLYGGAPKGFQIRQIESGADVVIATPGRLNDLIGMRKANVGAVQYFIMDEADRMLDMGFEPQIREIIAQLPRKRQNLFFSATWPKEVRRLAEEFLLEPIHINIGSTDLVANSKINQNVMVMDEGAKYEKLINLLDDLGNDKANPAKNPRTLIFTSKKSTCDYLANELWRSGYASDSIHGDREQWQRTKVMNQFKSGELTLLIATDVAARGIDVKDIKYVINYDFPASGTEDYVHRIGRTARGNALEGTAYTFFTYGDKKHAAQLIKVMQQSKQVVPPELQEMVSVRSFGRGSGGGGRGRFGGGGGRGRFGGGGGGGRRW